MIKFPSIEQYRNVIRHVKTHAQYAGKDDNVARPWFVKKVNEGVGI